LKKGLATAGKRALKAGADILEDVVVNKTPIKQAIKKQAKSEMQNIKKQIVGSQQKTINRGSLKSKQVIKPKKKKQARRKKPRGGFQQITL
jgi:precorrin isomerase